MLDEREGPVAPRGAAARVQPADGGQRFAIVARRAGRQLPARDRALLGAVHARRAGRQARCSASRCATRRRRRRGLRPAATPSPASATSRVATWQDVRWVLLQARGAARTTSRSKFTTPRGGTRLPRSSTCRGIGPEQTSTATSCEALGLARFQPALDAGDRQTWSRAAPAERAGLQAGRRDRRRRRPAGIAAGTSWSPRVSARPGTRAVARQCAAAARRPSSR